MAVGCQDKDHNLVVEDTIYHAMFLRYLAAPTAFGLSSQRFGMTCPCHGMLPQFLYKTQSFGKGFRLTPCQTSEICVSLLCVDYPIWHNQSS